MAFYCVRPTFVYYLHLADVILNIDLFLIAVIELLPPFKLGADFHLPSLGFFRLPLLPSHPEGGGKKSHHWS